MTPVQQEDWAGELQDIDAALQAVEPPLPAE
jgi:hypothetical protein